MNNIQNLPLLPKQLPKINNTSHTYAGNKIIFNAVDRKGYHLKTQGTAESTVSSYEAAKILEEHITIIEESRNLIKQGKKTTWKEFIDENASKKSK